MPLDDVQGPFDPPHFPQSLRQAIHTGTAPQPLSGVEDCLGAVGHLDLDPHVAKVVAEVDEDSAGQGCGHALDGVGHRGKQVVPSPGHELLQILLADCGAADDSINDREEEAEPIRA